MHRGYRDLSSLFLTAALAAPLAMMAATSPQDNHDQENKQHNKRYYDKSHKDYHTWDGNETARTSATRPSTTRRVLSLS